MTLEEAIKYCKDKEDVSEGYKQILEMLEEWLERRNVAKYYGISLAEFDDRDYEWLVKQVTGDKVLHEREG
jgi:molecular chaperone GrpE (heat shock protein)